MSVAGEENVECGGRRGVDPQSRIVWRLGKKCPGGRSIILAALHLPRRENPDKFAGPNVLVRGASAASRPCAMRIRPIRGALLRGSKALIGTAEVWIALRFMGFPVTVNEALVIESLLQAVRGAAFAIPGAFGAQEAGLILLCGLFEIPPDQALALSLIKRAADLVVGVPGLVSLQVLEGGRLKAHYSHAREGRARNRP